MKISIITTVYNGEKYIEETLESVLTQRGDFELEYIVVDGKSTDSTLSKINKYKALVDKGFYDGRNRGATMEVVSEKDNGMYDGIAKGFKKCSGDVIAYINADDFYSPNTFACVTEIFGQNKDVKWITGRCTFYNNRGHNTFSILRVFEDKELIRKGGYGLLAPYYIPQESTFWTKELLDKVDFNEFASYKQAGDFYLWHTFAEFEKLYVVDSVFSGFRVVENQLSADIDSCHEEMMRIIGDAKLSVNEKMKLQRVIDKNENLTDVKKYKYGIFHYDNNRKKWVRRSNKFLQSKKTFSLASQLKKLSLKNLFRHIV